MKTISNNLSGSGNGSPVSADRKRRGQVQGSIPCPLIKLLALGGTFLQPGSPTGTRGVRSGPFSFNPMNRIPNKPMVPVSDALGKEEAYLVQNVVSAFMVASQKVPPGAFMAMLCGGVITNVVGNLPEDYWQQCKDITPCGNPGCDCHVLQTEMVAMLQKLRDDWKSTLNKRHGAN